MRTLRPCPGAAMAPPILATAVGPALPVGTRAARAGLHRAGFGTPP